MAQSKLSKRISVLELDVAELRLLKYDQRTSFKAVFDAVERGKKLTTATCGKKIRRLNPFVHFGLLRVGGRIENAHAPFETRHFAILPCDCEFARLVISYHHELVEHAGINYTFTSLRRSFWICGGSSAIRRVIEDCAAFRRQRACPLQQLMAELPPGTYAGPPFFHTGVDYFGPLLAKQERSKVKRYGCIFTCMTSRAVHLEVAHSLSSDSFISALRRFISRRGSVSHIYTSTTGRTLLGQTEFLKKSIKGLNQNQISQFLLRKEINWHFNTPFGQSLW